MILGGALIVLLGAGGFVLVEQTLNDGCGRIPTYELAAAPAIAPMLTDVIRDLPKDQVGCTNLKVKEVEPAKVITNMAADDGPDLWMPDSTYWIAQISATQMVQVSSRSVASTPMVLTGKSVTPPSKWIDALRNKSLDVSDPTGNIVGNGPVLAALAEADGGRSREVTDALPPLAKKVQAHGTQPSPRAQFQTAAEGTAIVATTEQEVDQYGQDLKLTSVVPFTGSFFLDFPIAVTSPATGEDISTLNDAATGLAEHLASDDGLNTLAEAGLRGPDRNPIPGKRGVGRITSLTPRDPNVTRTVMQRFTMMSTPIRMLGLIDVSGSMAFPARGGTRMDLVVRAGITATQKLPASTSLGLWAFSEDLGGRNTDYKELVPIAKLDSEAGGTQQRVQLQKQLRSLPRIVDGSTGLYDSTLAAWRRVQKDYDPSAINGVMLLTDGENEDENSISLRKLLRTLQKEQDPAKPVPIIAIGISNDADAEVLQRIAGATGGTSYIARRPEEVSRVFTDALGTPN